MRPYWDNGVVQFYHGDARQGLLELPAESVHCVVTSPPYWGLRDYGLGADALGLEPTIDLYVQHIVEIFREVRRVLRNDGTLWCNLGDSYASSGLPGFQQLDKLGERLGTGGGHKHSSQPTGRAPTPAGLKPKDLCMMPARVALALQADGWWLRSDIVWSKLNPMPEGVTDRPTRAHEYMFLLTKAERYYYDAEAIREPDSGQKAWPTDERNGIRASKKPDGWETGPGAHGSFHRDGREQGEVSEIRSGRNKRSVWEIATEPYPEAHFATFPQKLVEPCILAGTSERGVCPDCGAPWQREVEVSEEYRTWAKTQRFYGKGGQGSAFRMDKTNSHVAPLKGQTTGWRATCECGQQETVPGTVLDPFAGSGTVAFVAQRLGRQSVGIDLSDEYLALAAKRLQSQPLPMAL